MARQISLLLAVVPLAAAFTAGGAVLKQCRSPVVRTSSSSIQMINLFGSNGAQGAGDQRA